MHPSFKLSLVFLLFLQSLTTHHRRKTPAFEEKTFSGQLKCILVLELPAATQLDLVEPMTLILALIQEVKAMLKDGIYFYKEFGVEEVVDLKTIQCVIGHIEALQCDIRKRSFVFGCL
jgi:hypothetical protein